MIEIKINGLKQLDQALKNFPLKVQKKYIFKALRAGAEVIKEQAIHNIPNKTGRSTGNLARNIGFDRAVTKGSTTTIAVDIKKISKAYVANEKNLRRRRVGKKYKMYGPGYYGRILEKGWHRRGVQYWYPFMLPAFEQKGEEAVVAFTDSLAASLNYDYGRD